MKTLALAAAVAALLSGSAIASDYVTSTVTAVDQKQHSVTLADKTVMIVSKDVDLTSVVPGMKVAISFYGDEDGMEPATSVEPTE